ncbi:MAG: mitochondrial fission ELM1 family protein [Proteobacteria bacterium]|nr:mitochondrial fission ELM1 family protein [Pseudomonadota bacterium]
MSDNQKTCWQKTCWVITDGSAGMENQALGLAEALECSITVKRIRLKQFWTLFAPFFRGLKRFCFHKESESLSPPWPDLVLACGRRSVLPALFIKEESKGRSQIVYLQNPKISPKHFDVLICPHHDKVRGKNVIKMLGAPHRVTDFELKQGYQDFASLFSKYKGPRIGVILGGPNKVFNFSIKTVHTIIEDLLKLQRDSGGSLLISPSRRTPQNVVSLFQETFSHNPNVYIWDRTGKNPYFGLLAWSDALLITIDSVSMTSEACATTKPIFIIRLPGGSKKFSSFHEALIQMKRTQWFNGTFFTTPVPSFNETKQVAQHLKKLLKWES